MPYSIPEVNDPNIAHALFVDLTLGQNTYYLSSGYRQITINGNTYTELGSLLNITDVTTDLKTSSGDIQISLSGVPSEADYITTVMNTPIKGGTVVVRRGFFNTETLEPIANAIYNRFSGFISNWSITEDLDLIEGKHTHSITVSCSSINSILDVKTSGQRTNDTDRKRFYPGDISFDRVKDLQHTDFDFGKKYSGGSGYGAPQQPNWPGLPNDFDFRLP